MILNVKAIYQLLQMLQNVYFYVGYAIMYTHSAYCATFLYIFTHGINIIRTYIRLNCPLLNMLTQYA